ncbi:MAG TPA: hypothetical protein VLM79_13680 [Kofleriaceae bacterium]|nr:hypothetical protein [Kofleriaceae bacterium]
MAPAPTVALDPAAAPDPAMAPAPTVALDPAAAPNPAAALDPAVAPAAPSTMTSASGMPHVVVGATDGARGVLQRVRPGELRAAAGTSDHSTRI